MSTTSRISKIANKSKLKAGDLESLQAAIGSSPQVPAVPAQPKRSKAGKSYDKRPAKAAALHSAKQRIASLIKGTGGR
ncbi:MAG TPA: hypothetical protein VHU23_01020 [Rhizomicrobium sp.]|jgi:hypothetical protein|nr:hypothetical protein [Rhizomicrobium sp.]